MPSVKSVAFFSRDRRLAVAMALLVGLVGIVLYLPTLRLPLIYDTLLHIRITKELDWVSVWLPTTSFGFYRPLTFAPLLLIKDLFGYYPAPLLHGINVIQHGLNGALLTLLAWRLWGRRPHAVAAGLLLAVFPFSYQAVAVYGHNVHPHLTNMLLLGLHGYVSGLRTGRFRWWALTIGAFLLALLSHESAILFGPLAGIIHWQIRGDGELVADVRRLGRALVGQPQPFLRDNAPWLLLTAGGIVYFLGYQLLPITRAPQAASFSGGEVTTRILFVIQSAAQPLVALLGEWSTVRFWPVMIAAAAILLVLTVLSARAPGNRWPLLTGYLWWGMASAVLVIPLPTGYLLNGPRLLYLGSVGVALVWPILLDPLLRIWRDRPAVGQVAWSGVLVLILVANARFVTQRLEAYAALTSPIRLGAEVLADRPVDEGLLLVNLPNWIAPAEQHYPVGAEFVQMMGDYLFVEELVEENAVEPAYAPGRPARAVVVRDLQRSPPYTYDVYGQAPLEELAVDWAPAGSSVIISFYEEAGVAPRFTGRLAPIPETETETVAVIGPYRVYGVEAVACDGAVTVTTMLGNEGGESGRSPTTSLFVQLLDDAGQLIAQADAPPLGLRPDLLAPVEGWGMIDRRELPAAAGSRVLLGAYDFATGERFPAVDAGGAELADRALVVPVTGCE